MAVRQTLPCRTPLASVAPWVLSVLLHVGAVAACGLFTAAVNLGASLPPRATDWQEVSVLAASPALDIAAPSPVDAPPPVPLPESVAIDWPEPDYAFLNEAVNDVDGEAPAQSEIAGDIVPAPVAPQPPRAKSSGGRDDVCALATPFEFSGNGSLGAPGGGAGGASANGLQGAGDGGLIGLGGAAAAGAGAGNGALSGNGGRGAGNAGDGGVGNGVGEGNGSGPAGSGVRPPRPVKMARGSYPPEARRSGAAGTVTLLLQILASGKVGCIEVAASSGSDVLDRAAREAAQDWRFLPAELDGRAIASEARVEYHFRLVESP